MISNKLSSFINSDRYSSTCKPDAYKSIHYYFLITGIFAFIIFALYRTGLLISVLEQDTTRLSLIISLIFIFSLGLSFWFSLRLSLITNQFFSFHQDIAIRGKKFDPVHDYFGSITNKKVTDQTATEVLAEKIKGHHQINWFLVGLVIKLGLLGTVIGFVIMLRSVADLNELDLSAIKTLMQQMTQGMGIAMNTTMVGLGCSIFISIQTLCLDRLADQLLVRVLDADTAKVDL